jgi:hypothetical protein
MLTNRNTFQSTLLIQPDSRYTHIHAQLKLSYGQGYTDSIQTEHSCSTPVQFMLLWTCSKTQPIKISQWVKYSSEGQPVMSTWLLIWTDTLNNGKRIFLQLWAIMLYFQDHTYQSYLLLMTAMWYVRHTHARTHTHTHTHTCAPSIQHCW